MAQTRQPTADRQRQIAEAALRLLASKGVTGLTAKNLGAAVGISDGAVFKHFPNKAAILEAAISTFESLLDDPRFAPGSTPLAKLKTFFLHRVGRVRAHPEILSLAFSTHLEAAAGEQGAERVRRIVASSRAFVQQCLHEGQLAGEVRDTASPEVLCWMVLGVLRATATKRIGQEFPERIWQEVADTIGSAARANKERLT